jgi:alpha-L-fucosidase
MSRSRGLRLALLVLLLLGTDFLLRAQWAPLVHDANAESRIAWWRQARFGMFLHWGVYAIPARGEWVMWNEQIPVGEYAKLAEQFHPEHYDANAWAALAKEGGMKYMVLTARHHDGFALFDDPGSTFTAMKSAAHRDIVAEYVKAVRAAGLGVGLYYSPLDWRFPGYFFPSLYKENAEELRAQFQRQLDELGSRYGKIDILWFDGGGNEWLGFGGIEFHNGKWRSRPDDKPYADKFDWRDDETIAHLRKLQPEIIIDDRTDAAADYRIRESYGELGGFENRYPWELCTTIAENGAWGYDAKAKVKPLAELIHVLVSTAGRDGNFLLNVGPMPDGQIAPEQAERVREIGKWLTANGESIYSTRGGPWLPAAYGVSTHTGKYVYVHVLRFAKDSTVTLPALGVKIVSASKLGGPAVAVEQSEREVTFRVPAEAVDAIDTVIKVELEEPWTTAAVVPVPDATGEQAKH